MTTTTATRLHPWSRSTLETAGRLVQSLGWSKSGLQSLNSRVHIAANYYGLDADQRELLFDAIAAELGLILFTDELSSEAIDRWNREQRDRRKVARLLRRVARKL